MATSAAPTAAAKQSQRQWRGQLGRAGAREAEGAPGVFSVSLSAARPGTPVPALLVVAASAPAAGSSQVGERSRRTRSQRREQPAGVAEPRAPAPAPRRAQPQRGPGPEPRAAAARGGGRAGGGAAGAALRGAIPERSTRRLPSHLPRRPLASLAASCPARLRIQAHLFPPGFRAPRLAGTLGSDAEGCDFSCVVLCVHRQDR